MKRVLITAGPVYGKLDDNKIVSNRSRGDWALAFARYLLGFQSSSEPEYHVTLLVPKTISKKIILEITEIRDGEGQPDNLTVIYHDGYDDYRDQCYTLAKTHDAAVMAAAVVNWIPAEPVKGKMATEGYKPGDRINIPFYLAPRVIDEMRKINPNLVLIGCKLLSGASKAALIDAAYHVLINAKCHAVIANDLSYLRQKHIVMPDRSVHTLDNDFVQMYRDLQGIIDDAHYQTRWTQVGSFFEPPIRENRENRQALADAWDTFDRLVSQYRHRFTPDGDGRVFGSLAVRIIGDYWLVSPREKGQAFNVHDAAIVLDVEHAKRTVWINLTDPKKKATLNAPLLIRVGNQYKADVVLHLHEQLLGGPTVPYAPPGTERDNNREIPGRQFNIEGHGFIACLKTRGESV